MKPILMKTNKHNMRVQYREALERLRAAEDEAAAVKARYNTVLADVTAKQKIIEQEVEQLEDALDRAIEIADQTPTAALKPTQASSPPQEPSEGTAQADAPPYLREVILLIPIDGDTGFKDIMNELGCPRKTLATRFAKGKNKKLIESAGHGRYRLTALGKQVHARYAPTSLQLVTPPASDTGN